MGVDEDREYPVADHDQAGFVVLVVHPVLELVGGVAHVAQVGQVTFVEPVGVDYLYCSVFGDGVGAEGLAYQSGLGFSVETADRGRVVGDQRARYG